MPVSGRPAPAGEQRAKRACSNAWLAGRACSPVLRRQPGPLRDPGQQRSSPAAIERGLAADALAPRFAFNFTAGADVLEAAALFRATRRLWARIMPERFAAREPASWVPRTEADARALVEEVERRGGMGPAIESGWAQQQIAEAGREQQRPVERAERVVVGVDRFVDDDPWRWEVHRHLDQVEAEREAGLGRLPAEPDRAAVKRALDDRRAAAATDANLVEVLTETVETCATVEEMCATRRQVFGQHRGRPAY